MIIAVTHENGQVFQHFGHTELFKLFRQLLKTFSAVFALHIKSRI